MGAEVIIGSLSASAETIIVLGIAKNHRDRWIKGSKDRKSHILEPGYL
jgi:hypothetical protein